MGRDYCLKCRDCESKIDWETVNPFDAVDMDHIFDFLEAFNNCMDIDDNSEKVDIAELRAWLVRHEGHAIYFGW